MVSCVTTDHRARPKHITMHRDALSQDLGENSSGLHLSIQRLVMCPHSPLHSPILRRIHVVPRTFDFAGVAAVRGTLVGLNPPLTQPEEFA
jgi:hypothetical protein